MTWIVVASVLDAAVFVSDVRVSVGAQPVAGCQLQKLHHVGGRVLAGFAGSVECGFAAMECLRRCIQREGPRYAFNLRAMVTGPMGRVLRPLSWWRPGARVDVLVARVDARRPVGPFRGWPWIYRFSSPRFVPEHVPTTTSIGSGTDRYRRQLEISLHANSSLFRPWGSSESVATKVAMYMRACVDLSPDSTVSPEMVAGLTTADAWAIEPLLVGIGDRPPIPLPPLARTWDEFVAASRSRGVHAAEATA